MGLAEEELQPLVDSWRAANPNIVKFWWDVDRAVKTAVKQKKQADVNGIRFFCQSGMLFIQLPSGRRLAYVKPRMGLDLILSLLSMKELAVLRSGSVLKAMVRSSWRISFRLFQGIFCAMP